MNHTSIILKSANNDIADAFDWHYMQIEFAVAHLIKRLDETVRYVAESSLIHQKIHLYFRQIVLKPFPYVLVYSVKGDEIIVFRLWHYSRKPHNKFK